MRHLWRNALTGLLVLAALAGVFSAGFYLGSTRSARADDSTEFASLWNVRSTLERTFIGEIPSVQRQAWGAARGLVSSYGDPYTVFVEPAAREVERDDLRGHFGGIGATLGRDAAGNLVLTVIRDRPAARAGVLDNDILLLVDGTPITADMPVEEVVALVRGPEGTQVTLTLRRTGLDEPFEVSVTRERIEMPSVDWRVLDAAGGIGYAKVQLFGERTSDELRGGLNELAAAGVERLVLDLRGNGGGLVDAAVDIASQFLKDGNVLREQKRGGQERHYPVVTTGGPAREWDLVVLVDGGTASASEIVAGALRDQGRAVLIGEKTFGKGSVQEVHEYPDGTSLHVTVARWFTPARQQIDGSGLLPDVQAGISEDDRRLGRDPQLEQGIAWLEAHR